MRNFKMKTALIALTCLAVGGTSITSAHDYTHPRDLNMPASTFKRPDPASMQTIVPSPPIM